MHNAHQGVYALCCMACGRIHCPVHKQNAQEVSLLSVALGVAWR